ncbi:hypothetical protein TrVE_jg5970 [Triparma verrucosa]|uniref:Glycosyltransferase 61 catalytic domain-containing protein n=1 Tax=Triparma verrucosa TaxID=1606542 RepID=A0A9W7BQ77_9STRA|nr:hypothetical protein TrVE_jg5970 [Triparma verrucosa]
MACVRLLGILVAINCAVFGPLGVEAGPTTTITWEDRDDIVAAQITSYKVYNKAREVSGVSIPFTSDDGRIFLATWKPNNYDIVSRDLIDRVANMMAAEAAQRGVSVGTKTVPESLWRAVENQCWYWGEVECRGFEGVGEPKFAGGPACCFWSAGDQLAGGAYVWMHPQDSEEEWWERVGDEEETKDSSKNCSSRGERGSCADDVGGAWLWNQEGDGGGGCVTYSASEQASFRAALPSLFPTVASTGKGVVDFGGSVGMYAAAFPEGAGRRVTVEPLVSQLCLFPGATLDSTDYLSGPPPIETTTRGADPTLLSGDFELVMSLEAAEHVHPSKHPLLIRWLARALRKSSTSRLLFSAAMPSQHGDGHVGCKTPARWRRDIEWFSREAGNPLVLDIEKTEVVRAEAGEYLNHILLCFKLAEPIAITMLNALEINVYRSVSSLKNACVDGEGSLIVVGEEMRIIQDAVPWGYNIGEQCLDAFCQPRQLKVKRAEKLPADLETGSTLFVHDSHTLLNFGHAFSDFAREVAYFVTERGGGFERLVIPKRWSMINTSCTPTEDVVLHQSMRSSGLKEFSWGGCEPLAAWLYLALKDSYSQQKPDIVEYDNDVDTVRCFSELVIPGDLDRDGLVMDTTASKQAKAISLFAEAAKVKTTYLPVRSGKEIQVSVYGRQDAPRRRLGNYNQLKDLLVRTKFCGEMGEIGLNVTEPIFGDMTMHDQISLWGSADVMIAPRGAHAAGLAFMRPGSLYVEIMPPCRTEDWEVFQIARLRGVFLVQIPGEGNCVGEDAPEGDFKISLEEIETVRQLIGCEELGYDLNEGRLLAETCNPICVDKEQIGGKTSSSITTTFGDGTEMLTLPFKACVSKVEGGVRKRSQMIKNCTKNFDSYESALLLPPDIDGGTTNLCHFAWHCAIPALTASLRHDRFDVTFETDRNVSSFTDWQSSFLNLVTASSPILDSTFFSSKTACAEKLTVVSPSIQLVGGVIDAQSLRSLVAKSYPRVSSYYEGRASFEIEDRLLQGSPYSPPGHSPLVTLLVREPGVGKGRQLLNQEEVVNAIGDVLSKLFPDLRSSIKVISFDEKTPFEEQMTAVAKSTLVISIHGAALVNTMFMPPGTSVIEISSERFEHPIFQRLSANSGLHHYRYLASESEGETEPNYSDIFRGWTSAACTADIRCRIPNKEVDIRVKDILRFKRIVNDALSAAFPDASNRKNLTASDIVCFSEVTGRYEIC